MNNIKEIDRYVEGTMEPDEVLLFEEKIRRDSLLRVNVSLHKEVLAIVRIYHRKKLKQELEALHKRVFNDPLKAGFRQRVMRIFGEY